MRNAQIITIQQDVVVTNEDIDDIMCGALEGGITYWASEAEVVGEYLGEYGSEQISRGGTLKIYLDEPFDKDDTEVYELTKENFMKGLRMYLQDPQRPYDILDFDRRTGKTILDTGEADAVVCDIIIQYALFNEVVFG